MKKIVSLLVAAAAIWGCSDDTFEDERSDVNYDPSEVITVETNATPNSRGTMINSEAQMTTLGMFCSYTGQSDWTVSNALNKMFNQQLNRNASGQWIYVGAPVKWNSSNAADRYTFFSYAPFATGVYNASTNPTGNGIVVNGNASTTGIPTLTYTVPSNCPNQPDLVISSIRKNIRKSPSPVALSMQHALTSVGFRMIGTGQKVTKITVKGVKSTGTLALDGDAIAWTNVGGSSDVDAKITSGIILGPTGQQMNTIDGYLMMLPQTLDTNAKLVVTLDDNSTRQVSLNQQVWAVGKHIDYIMTISNTGLITISPSTIYIPSGGEVWGSEVINVACEVSNQNWTMTSTDAWLQLSTNINGSGAGQSVSGQGNAIVYSHASANTGATDRTTTITMSGGTVVTVTQLKKIDPSAYVSGGVALAGTPTYVGAFWKAGQTGERIIRINVGADATNVGPWIASVAWMDSGWANGDIVMSTDATLDANVDFTTKKTPGNAESYLVNSTRSLVSGTVAANGYIYFRIGLKSTFTASDAKPARYAVVSLRYGNPVKEQLLYLRQGHDPDYLMRTNETGTPNSTIPSRPNVVRFSPYNLTATTMTNGGLLVVNHPILVPLVNPGTFTEFPTQTGAFFQWASTLHPLVAYNPCNPVSGLTDWSVLVPILSWTEGLIPGNLLSVTQEGCPKGYTLSYGTSVDFRRPNNGITNALLAAPTSSNSEILQSLWLAPQAVSTNNTLNFMYGYYADGFFDRRMLESATGITYPSVNQVVSQGNNDIACAGSLLVNPVTNASIFFPATGYRSSANSLNGALDATGVIGAYLTSSSFSTTESWVFTLGNFGGVGGLTNTAFQAHGNKAAGSPIRCVRN